MRIHRPILLAIGLLLGSCCFGCGGASSAQSAAASAPTESATSHAPHSERQRASDESSPGAGATQPQILAEGEVPATMAKPSAAPAPSPPASIAEAAESRSKRSDRPGLATQFGEDLNRDVRHASFERESMTTPFLTTTIWYNDAAGARTLAQQASSRSGNRAEVELLNGGLLVQITDSWFQVLEGFVADGRPYAIGEADARYALRIVNRTDFAFEVIASIDGLDVISGRPASFERRGYVLAAHDTVTIEGFRTSESQVAAFRFGKVAESYSAQMGHGDKNVGVIGVALFQERGKTPTYPAEDTRLRKDANPFPGNTYAPRPEGR